MQNRAGSASLRDTFVTNVAKGKKKSEKRRPVAKKLGGRYRFRAVTRMVLEYMEWIKEVPAFDHGIIGVVDVAKNARVAQGKRIPERKKLTLKDRSMLLTEIPGRSRETGAYLAALIKNLQPYKKYPEFMWDEIAAVTGYQYFGPERVLVRQGCTPYTLYYIVRGEVAVSKIKEDTVTGDKINNDTGTLGPGDMFGEVALLHSIPRSATVVTKTSVDLLTVTRRDFNVVLRPWLTEQWEIFKDAIVNFNYFEGWDEDTVRECCILSKVKDYQPGEVLLGDGKGMVNYVYFALRGQCRVIEHMIVREELISNKIKYRLYDPNDSREESLAATQAGTTIQEKSKVAEGAGASAAKDATSAASEIDYTQPMLSKRPLNVVDAEKTSISTLTLRDVVNEWHEITDIAAMLMKEPSTISRQTYPKNVKTIFMQVCMFYRGACFGLGEKMYNRRIVAISPTRCLLVPRYWLLEHNRANIWERVRLFMDSKYPTEGQLLKKFVENRRWMKYKRESVNRIIENGRKIPNPTTVRDVPYSLRIAGETDAIEGIQ